jgi:aminopeptidase-like protein
MIDAMETNEVPVNLFQGEVFCSRYGLNIDAYSNPEGNRALFDILFLIDGTRSVTEIARICNVSVQSVRSVLEELRVRGLIAYAPIPRG